MREYIAELSAITQSRRFTAYFEGIPVRLPTGDTLTVKVEHVSRTERPLGLRFSEFSYMAEVSAGPHVGLGFGEAPTKLLALQKSVAEGVERTLYHALKATPYGTLTSNGWAAHLSRERAFRAAMDELVERDAVLVHWMGRMPMVEIQPSSWPAWLSSWTNQELKLSPKFNTLRVLMTSEGHKPTLTTVLLASSGHAVLSHASARTVEEALQKALAETCRIAHIAAAGAHLDTSARLGDVGEDASSITPEDHAMYYAYHEKLPDWIFGQRITWRDAQTTWNAGQLLFDRTIAPTLDARFVQVSDGPIFVGYATCEMIQNLFFGPTKDAQSKGLINVRRLGQKVKPDRFNLMPHCVP